MRTRLLDAPWRVLALATGVPFGTFMAVFDIVVDHEPLQRGSSLSLSLPLPLPLPRSRARARLHGRLAELRA